MLKCHWNVIFVSYFLHSIYSFKRAYNHGELYFCQILMESVVFCCQNPLFGVKMCPGSGTEFKDLIRGIDSLIFLLDLFKFILSLSFSAAWIGYFVWASKLSVVCSWKQFLNIKFIKTMLTKLIKWQWSLAILTYIVCLVRMRNGYTSVSHVSQSHLGHVIQGDLRYTFIKISCPWRFRDSCTQSI